ncbi:hypothetical protein [Raineyella antarctica]|nr:hypothetical protein [Raineyella antarctica]
MTHREDAPRTCHRGIDMGGDEKQASWWTTLPGILTAIAAIITAVTGLVLRITFSEGESTVPLQVAPV